MSQFAELVKNGLQLNALKLDSNVDPIKTSRDEQMLRIVNANGLRTDALPTNGLHYINVLSAKIDDDTDPMIAAQNEQTQRILNNNR